MNYETHPPRLRAKARDPGGEGEFLSVHFFRPTGAYGTTDEAFVVLTCA